MYCCYSIFFRWASFRDGGRKGFWKYAHGSGLGVLSKTIPVLLPCAEPVPWLPCCEATGSEALMGGKMSAVCDVVELLSDIAVLGSL